MNIFKLVMHWFQWTQMAAIIKGHSRSLAHLLGSSKSGTRSIKDAWNINEKLVKANWVLFSLEKGQKSDGNLVEEIQISILTPDLPKSIIPNSKNQVLIQHEYVSKFFLIFAQTREQASYKHCWKSYEKYPLTSCTDICRALSHVNTPCRPSLNPSENIGYWPGGGCSNLMGLTNLEYVRPNQRLNFLSTDLLTLG